jgi:four helix bundle protein
VRAFREGARRAKARGTRRAGLIACASAVVRIMADMDDYHRLRVWQKAHALSLAVAGVVPRRPARRDGPLITQIIKSAESIPTNIVEGRAADTDAEFARFLGVSLKSSGELRYQLESALERGIIKPAVFDRLRIMIVEVQVLLEAFIRKLHDDDSAGPNRTNKRSA